METEAVERLAAIEHGVGPDSATPVCAHDPYAIPECEWRAERFLAALRADPAAARAVRDAIDPDGLRTALAVLLYAAEEMDDGLTEHGQAIRGARVALIEGTPDAD